MKKILLLATAAIMLFACNKEDNVSVSKMGSHEFYASIEETAPGTKIYADEDLKVLWNEGDLISVFNKTNRNDEYESDAEDGDNACGLDLKKEGTAPSPQVDLDYIYAVYPYSADNAAVNGEDGVKLNVVLPADQNYREKSFGIGANTMVAVTDANFFGFKNVCGYLRFRFYGDNVTVKSVTFEGNNGEKIAGNAVITPVFGSTPTVAMQDDATGRISLNCEQPVKLATEKTEATEFIFVVPPTAFTGGFKIMVTDVNGKVFEKASTRSLTISRNKIESMGAMKVEPTLNRYELVTMNDAVDDGEYVLAYHDAEGFKLFSFNKTMANAETAANNVKDVHGLSGLLSKGSEIYATVVGKNYVTVEGEEGADYINVPEDVEADAMLSVTGNYSAANLTLSSGSYSLRLDKVITNINSDFSATLSVQPNAPDVLNIMYALRGGKVVVTFDEMIDFAVAQAKKEGVTFTDEQIDRLRSGFVKLCKIAKEMMASHNVGDLMDIDLNTNVFDVIAQYYDNVAAYSLQVSEEKKFGWATPIGFYKGDDGFTANIALPQAGWFDRIDESLEGDTDAFIAYWANIDKDYNILDFENFFQRLARRFVNEVDPSTYALLQQVDFSAIGRVYGRYVNRFNDKLEPVYLYKKVK